jgi:hypothetical protein
MHTHTHTHTDAAPFVLDLCLQHRSRSTFGWKQRRVVRPSADVYCFFVDIVNRAKIIICIPPPPPTHTHTRTHTSVSLAHEHPIAQSALSFKVALVAARVKESSTPVEFRLVLASASLPHSTSRRTSGRSSHSSSSFAGSKPCVPPPSPASSSVDCSCLRRLDSNCTPRPRQP